MGWQTDDGEHEGWGAAVWADGTVSVGSTGTPDGIRAIVRQVGADGRLDRVEGTDDMVRDGREAIGWRAICECGWQGQLWERVTSRAQHDLATRRLFDGDPRIGEGGTIDVRVWGEIPDEIEDVIWEEWRSHLPAPTIAAVSEAAAMVRRAQERLAEAVRAAREDGRSWAEIGEAAGMTRQSAHERWGR